MKIFSKYNLGSKDKAEAILNEDKADLVAFGRTFLANPDLVNRMRNNLPLNKPDDSTSIPRRKRLYGLSFGYFIKPDLVN